MKAVNTLVLVMSSLAAQAWAQEAPEAQADLPAVAAEASFSQEARPGPAQLPDVNEQDGLDSLMPSFAAAPQNQALMLGGLLAMGFMVRRRREN